MPRGGEPGGREMVSMSHYPISPRFDRDSEADPLALAVGAVASVLAIALIITALLILR
jgi:hypothetical protein